MCDICYSKSWSVSNWTVGVQHEQLTIQLVGCSFLCLQFVYGHCLSSFLIHQMENEEFLQLWKFFSHKPSIFFFKGTQSTGDYVSWPWEETYAATCVNCKIIPPWSSGFSPLADLSAKHDLAGFGNGVRGRQEEGLSDTFQKKTPTGPHFPRQAETPHLVIL